MKERIEAALESHRLLTDKTRGLTQTIAAVAARLIAVLESGHKILLCGNGGSAADAQHIAAELTGRFIEKTRQPLAAIALTTDTSALTALGNDFGFEQIFSRQIEALFSQGDLVIGLTTSGNSPNIVRAMETAKRLGGETVALTGGDGGQVRSLVDVCLIIPSNETPRVQEMHITVGHILCDLIDQHFSGK